MATLIDPEKLPWKRWRGLETARFKLIFSGDRTPTGELTFGLAELEPGEELSRHRHEEAEVYVILSGEGICEVGVGAAPSAAGTRAPHSRCHAPPNPRRGRGAAAMAVRLRR